MWNISEYFQFFFHFVILFNCEFVGSVSLPILTAFTHAFIGRSMRKENQIWYWNSSFYTHIHVYHHIFSLSYMDKIQAKNKKPSIKEVDRLIFFLFCHKNINESRSFDSFRVLMYFSVSVIFHNKFCLIFYVVTRNNDTVLHTFDSKCVLNAFVISQH